VHQDIGRPQEAQVVPKRNRTIAKDKRILDGFGVRSVARCVRKHVAGDHETDGLLWSAVEIEVVGSALTRRGAFDDSERQSRLVFIPGGSPRYGGKLGKPPRRWRQAG
jgi:hypothetical protein